MFSFLSKAQADERLWAALRSGAAVAMIRHTVAPGIGDPDHFRLDDCATQRNLSAEGQRQAQAIGAAFRDNGIVAAQVLSSRWCRCLDTARLLDLGTVEPFPPLDSFFSTPERAASQTTELRERLRQDRAGQPLVLVTHQVNITALTGVVPGSGEMVVIRPATGGSVEVLGRLPPVGNRN
ncbi:MAG: histidine phosphatase family protein [Synechococcaceae cyanobacterium SM1_2_3]|nr:histidine phosphatase family protein [Synechococcaceae cyanobacterium SM1_2_3]